MENKKASLSVRLLHRARAWPYAAVTRVRFTRPLPIVTSPYQAQKGVSRERRADSKNKQQENHKASTQFLLHTIFLEGPGRKQVWLTSVK